VGRRLTVTGFNLLVERARVLPLTQEPSVSPPVCRSPTGDSTPASPTRPTIQGSRRLQVLATTTDQHGPPREDKSQNTSQTPAATCDVARTLEPYLERVTRVLERLESLVQRSSPVMTPRSKPRVPTPTKPKQRTVVRYIVKKYDDHAHREAEAQSTSPVDTLASDVSDTPPSRDTTPRGQSPAREDGADTSQSSALDEGSTDEAETSHTPPMPYYQEAAAFI